MEGFKFRREQPIGKYVVDFANLEKKLVIEVDGGQHAMDPGDRVRDEWLRAEGYKVLRFWDNEVFSNLEGVLEMIRKAFLTPHPDPLPQGAGSGTHLRLGAYKFDGLVKSTKRGHCERSEAILYFVRA